MARTHDVSELKFRLHKLRNNGKNLDSPGVVKKLERQIRRMEGGR